MTEHQWTPEVITRRIVREMWRDARPHRRQQASRQRAIRTVALQLPQVFPVLRQSNLKYGIEKAISCVQRRHPRNSWANKAFATAESRSIRSNFIFWLCTT
jgi:hypothetical protein